MEISFNDHYHQFCIFDRKARKILFRCNLPHWIANIIHKVKHKDWLDDD